MRTKAQKILPEQRKGIRAFLNKYPFVTQVDMANLFCVSKARMSEIYRKDVKRGGD